MKQVSKHINIGGSFDESKFIAKENGLIYKHLTNSRGTTIIALKKGDIRRIQQSLNDFVKECAEKGIEI